MTQSIRPPQPASTTVDEVVDALGEQGYIADTRLATTVFLATRLDKPLLIEGPAGVGKTELAKALAAVTGRRLLRLQCYEGQDETKALYEWDYGKQLLYTQMLREKIGQVVAGRPRPGRGRRADRRPGERVLLRALPGGAPAAGGDPLRGAGGAAHRRGRPRRRGARGRAARDAGRVPGLGAGGRHVRREDAAVRHPHQQQHARPLGRAQAPLPAPVPRLPDRRARAGDRPVEEHRAAATRWPRSWWRSCAGCGSWSCASRRRSRRRSTGRARWRCSAWRS